MSDDISATIVAKSDQLNADDLVGGPITVQITKVVVTETDQPVTVHLNGGYRPWKPCKTARRLLVFGWGPKSSEYVGRWITLYRDPDTLWAGKAVGGIRPSAMSDIQGPFTLPLSYAKNKKTEYKVAKLTPPANGKPTVDPAFAAFGAELVAATKNGWTNERVKAILGCPAADVPVERRAEIVAALKAGPQTGGEA